METINAVLWGPFTVGAILLCGIYHTYKSGSILLRLKKYLGGGKGSGRAVMSALAASMGTGNITGCAAAITTGGPGAVFWMWISALLGMALAYSENRLGGEYAERYPHKPKGPMLYIEKGLGSKKLAVIYAAACLCAALVMGCMSQTAALSEAVSEQGLMPKWTAGLISSAAAAFVIFSSQKAADAAMNAAEKLVPVMGLLYAGGCIALIILTGSSLSDIFREILTDAFTFRAAAGGIFGGAVSKAVSVGLRRGIFSNEAGMGSSVLVHSEGGFSSPESMGAWAALEVFLDTIVCCTLTALAILSSGKETLSEAFTLCFGRGGGIFICLCVCLFAWAAVLGWCCYGEKCLEYLAEGKESFVLYKLIFCLCGGLAGFFSLNFLFGLSDIINVFLIFPNLIAVTCLTIKEGKGRY
ncbi:MAG: alanine/glycine:cation symporter family protein [Huintestinicola sp.]|uniref:alanine/glycine:cation symporter family protein n=1 Tax=Huintestinicola sp. TaxID=2981661 RepID=UPI003F08C9EB